MAIFLSFSLAERQIGPELALLVVAAAGAERVPQLAVGDFRVGRRRRDEQHAVVGVDFRGRDRHAGIEMADHEFDAVADELVGDRDALLGIGDVVAGLDRRSSGRGCRPDLLKSSAAWPTPCVSCAPNEALAPVIGPATPIVTSASGGAAPKPSAKIAAAPLRNAALMLTSITAHNRLCCEASAIELTCKVDLDG